MSEGQESAWQAFCDGGTEEPSSCEEQEELETEEPAEEAEETTERMCLDCFTACVTGQFSPEALIAILGTMPVVEGKCTIRIEVTKV